MEPLRIPGLSKLIGPIRYDFFVGSVPGHSYPIDPWVHADKISFKPTQNLEFGFSAVAIWGGRNRRAWIRRRADFTPATCRSPCTRFLNSLFSFQNVSVAEKFSRDDPGYALRQLRFYLPSSLSPKLADPLYRFGVHDDISPVSAPRRSGVRPGMYLSHFPVIPKLDMRVEGVSTDPVSDSNANGNFLYWETIQRQGPTINGSLFTDWIGRDAKGGQAWLTYNLSPNENIQFMYRNAKVDQKFIPGGTTQNVYQGEVTKRVMKDIEIKGWVQYERWKAPIYKSGLQSDTTISAQIKWYPKRAEDILGTCSAEQALSGSALLYAQRVLAKRCRRSPPDICAGCSSRARPARWARYRAASRRGAARSCFASSFTRMNGTGFVVCAVCGPPETGSTIISALP